MTYDAIVVGGGLTGLRVAHQLALRGVQTLVLERATLGAGSSSRGVGGIRQQFGTAINIALSQISLPVFAELGERIGLRHHGYLYLALSEATHQTLQQRAAFQRSHGVAVELLDPRTVRERFPYLHTGDVVGAAFCASDGYASPPMTLQVYAEQARVAGVTIREGVTVTGIRAEGGHVSGVETDAETFSTAIVVNAAGPWAAQVAALAGIIELPVTPLKRQVWLTMPTSTIPPTAPMTIDTDTGWHFRPQDGALLLAMSGNEQPGETPLDLDPALGQQMLAHAQQRLPALTSQLAGGRAGFYEVTPDAHPVLGMADELTGFYLACGFSGHGFMHSPATGMLLASLICNESLPVDITPLQLSRFAEGDLLGEGTVL